MSTRVSVICFLVITVVLGAYYGAPFLGKGDQRAHLPGPTSHGHHQIEVGCDQCHTPFGGVKNDACSKCHGEALTAVNDSHSEGKFADPRNAERAAGLDARACVTCHREHVPGMTSDGVSIAQDFCIKCHADVSQERPSHKTFAPDSCGNSGCHNFHDNRALYEDFLLKHLHEPEELATLQVPLRGASMGKTDAGAPSPSPLTAKDRDAPAAAGNDAAITADWEKTAHARAGINCGRCHQIEDPSTGAAKWQSKIDRAACLGCHANEDNGFLKGLHGMRLASKLPPMTPELAQLPMKADAKHNQLGCNSCHKAHTFDTAYAAVEACVGCHDDEHTLAYKASRHFRLWELEQSGKASKGTGVSCATCHLPREVHTEGGVTTVQAQHNQNANLRPNDKMLRSVCMSCHGLGFSMDALADPDMRRRNFNGRPGRHVTSLELAEKRAKKAGD